MTAIYRLDSFSSTEGLYSFVTGSSSFYQVRISKDKRTLARFPQTDNSKSRLRQDTQELKIIDEFSIVVGKPAIFILEPLGIFGDSTIRITNIVKKISYMH